MPKPMNYREFRDHSTGSEYGTMLKGWKDRKPPIFNSVLHRTAGIYCLYIHKIPRLVTTETDKKVHAWSGNYNCWEDEKNIKRQYMRHEDDTRKFPPEKCGVCKLNEWFVQQIWDQKISWLEEVFKWEADDSDETRIVHPGGLTGLFGKKDLDDDEIEEMNKHGVYQKDAWMQSFMAKANYLLTVVDFDSPKDGVQTALETSLLGDKVQTVIDDQMSADEDNDGALGDPSQTPYVIQWEYDNGKNTPFNKRYHARPMRTGKKWEISEEINEMISADPPDLGNLIRPFNAQELRENLEKACLIKGVPWDDFFGKAQQASSKQASSRSESSGTRERAKSEPPPKSREKEQPKGPVANADGTITINGVKYDDDDPECDDCDQPMKMEDKKCPHCGKVYVVDEEAETPPPPTKERRKRGVPLTEADVKGKEPAKETPAPKGGRRGNREVFPGEGSDVPFAFCDVNLIGERWWRW